MDPITGLLAAGASLLGGFMNSSSTQAINAANIQQQNFMAGGGNLPSLVSNAKAAGLNPLAVLGNVSGGSPVQVGTDPGQGMMQAGKILADMKMPGADKEAELRQALTQAQIDNTNADTQRQLVASHLAVASQPGKPVKPDGTQAHPIPAFAYYKDDTGKVFKGQSREFGGSQFGIGAVPPGIVAGGYLTGENVAAFGKGLYDMLPGMPTVSPSVTRYFNSVGDALGQ